MTSSEPRIGLVLAGGGAKGAYQAGVLQYLAEVGFQPHILAGTSIGALNGAILASSPSFEQGVQRLDELWHQLAQANILRFNKGIAVDLLAYAAEASMPTFKHWVSQFLKDIGLTNSEFVLFDPEPIEDFLRQTVTLAGLKRGVELWVTAFPIFKIPGIRYDALTALVDLFRARTGTKAHWLHTQDCEDEELLYNTLLASAAIPLLFPTREVNGQAYVDGGLADNVPLGALAQQGCTHAIVIHLGNGVIWNRHDFPNQAIVEVRPYKAIDASDIPIAGSISALLDFSPSRIAELKRRGYEDGQRYLEPLLKTFEAIRNYRAAQTQLISSTEQLLGDAPLL